MKIILGCFKESFYELREETGALCYEDLHFTKRDDSIYDMYRSNVVAELFPLLWNCQEIIFDTTHIVFELSEYTESRITLKELHICMIYEKLFNKTVFYKNSIVIDKNSFREKYFDWMYDIGHNVTKNKPL